MRPGRPLFMLALAALLATAGCDAAEPVGEEQLVVEGFLDTGRPLPSIRISRTLSPLDVFDSRHSAVSDAVVEVLLGSRRIAYEAVPNAPGEYAPNEVVTAEEGDPFYLEVGWVGREARASGIVPPTIRIEDVHVVVPDEPVSAVLLDSLALSDSLAVGARTGFIYPIEVTVAWSPEDESEELWIRAQLRPYVSFSSTVVNLFLRSDEILRERDAASDAGGFRTWTGVYAVGVEGADDPMPPHTLRVALVRSGVDYARFASTRSAPERRAPISNVSGGVGIFTAISVDSARVQVSPNGGM